MILADEQLVGRHFGHNQNRVSIQILADLRIQATIFLAYGLWTIPAARRSKVMNIAIDLVFLPVDP